MLKLFLGLLLGGAIGAGMGYYGKCTSGTCPLTATPWRGGLYGAFMGILVAVAIGSGTPVNIEDVPKEVRLAGQKHVVQIESVESFQAIMADSRMPVLLDIYAEWCAPCRSMQPTIDKLAVEFEGNAVIAKLNIDNVPEVAKKYGVSKVPTVLIFSNGELVETVAGAHTSDRYSTLLNRILNK